MQKHTRSTLASMQSLIQNIEERMTSFASKEEVALNQTSFLWILCMHANGDDDRRCCKHTHIDLDGISEQ